VKMHKFWNCDITWCGRPAAPPTRCATEGQTVTCKACLRNMAASLRPGYLDTKNTRGRPWLR
jgi:hypothetical protein